MTVFESTHERVPFAQTEDLSSNQFDQLFRVAYRKFYRIIRKYVLFNTGFFFLALAELFSLALGFSFLARSSILAFCLALAFLTGFSYFILRLYLQTKIPDRLKELRDEFWAASKNILHYRKEVVQDRLDLAAAGCQFAAALYQKEYSFYPLPRWCEILRPIVEKLSCWWHWQDVLQMQELLLSSCIYEHLQLVKSEPTSLQVHLSLANVYVLLCTLYQPEEEPESGASLLWVPPGKFSDEMESKLQAAAARALEEFKVLQDLAPQDPEIHKQLATYYHNIQMPTEEIREYETLLSLRPDDIDSLYRLGVLYFEEGFNAKGLKAYEQLKKSHASLASSLITHYGSYEPLPLE